MEDIKLTEHILDIAACTEAVLSPTCGGIDVFIGTVRNHTKGKAVQYLEFEAYEKMALNELHKIIQTAKEQWPIERVVVHHRTGRVPIGEAAVVIAVAAAHRAAAF